MITGSNKFERVKREIAALSTINSIKMWNITMIIQGVSKIHGITSGTSSLYVYNKNS
jgi:hypothetical protein